jgi:hypothetical protein
MSVVNLSNGAPTLHHCIRPRPLVRGLGFLHRCHTVGTTFQSCSSNVASSTAVGLCLEFCWHQDVVPTSLHGAVPVLSSPFSVEGLFGLSWFFCRSTPGDAAPRRLSLLGSSVGTSSFCKWDCRQWCPSIQDIIQPPFSVVFAPHRQPAAVSTGWHSPTHLSGSCNDSYEGWWKISRAEFIVGKRKHLQVARSCLLQSTTLQIVCSDSSDPSTFQCMSSRLVWEWPATAVSCLVVRGRVKWKP